MALNGVVQSAPTGALGFDADIAISAATARAFAADGFQFCVRYVSRAVSENPGDLTAAEAAGILGAGLALMAVQHVRGAGWLPLPGMGSSDGNHAAQNARAIGFPTGVNLWCDLEGLGAAATAADAITFCNDWFRAVQSAGYAPGLYVGANSILTGEQLEDDLLFAHYWKSLSRVPDVAVRGYQMIQTAGAITHGVDIDRNKTQTDGRGGQVQWLAAALAGVATEAS